MKDSQPRRYFIYKIRRSDGKEYIGTTDSVCIRNRMCRHRSSVRFRGHPFECVILAESDSPDLFQQEKEYIQRHRTLYPDGLNVSVDGKGNHNAPSFSTRGFRFSEESRKRMSESSKKRIRTTGWKHSEVTKKQWSQERIGKCWKRPVLSREQWEDLCRVWQERPDLALTSNGKPISYERAFAKQYAVVFGLTPNGLFNLIANRLKTFRFPGEYPVRDSDPKRVSII